MQKEAHKAICGTQTLLNFKRFKAFSTLIFFILTSIILSYCDMLQQSMEKFDLDSEKSNI